MLSIKAFIDTICTFKGVNQSELAKQIDYTVPSLYRKTGSEAWRVRIGELESIVHKTGYRLRIELLDENSVPRFSMDSDPDHPLVDCGKIEEMRSTFANAMSDKFKYSKREESSGE